MVIDNIEKQSSLLAAAKYVDALSGLLGLIVYTKVFNPGSLGLYFIGIAISSLAVAACSGTSGSVRKRGSEKNSDVSSYYSLGITSALVCSILASFVVLGGYRLVTSGFLFIEYTVPFKIAAGAIIRLIPETLYRVNNSIYECKGKVALSGFFNTARGIAETVIQILLILYIQDIFMLFVGSTISTVAIGLIMYVYIDETIFKSFTIDHVRSIMRYAVWDSSNGILNTIEPNSVTVSIGSILSASATGIYGVANRTRGPTTYIPKSISKSLFVDTSYKKSDDNDSVSNLNLGLKYGTVIAIPVFAGALALSQEVLLLLYSESYTKGAIVLIGLSFGAILQSQSIILKGYLNGRDRPDTVAKSSVVRLIFSISILIPSLYYFGVVGVVVSHITSRIVRLIYMYYHIPKRKELDFIRSGIVPQSVSSIVMLGFVLLLRNFIGSGPLETMAMVGSGGILYFASLLVIDSDFRNRVKDLKERMI